MNLVSLNIRGAACQVKHNWVKEICSSKNINFFGFLDEKLIRSLWGSSGFDFEFLPSNGLSGGILSVWDSVAFQKSDSVKGSGFLAIKGVWALLGKTCFLVNVYAPQQINDKKKLWKDLLSLRSTYVDAIWILFGDFNEVREESDRIGSHFSRSGAFYFNEFIAESGLSDIRCGGRKFTRFSSDDSKLSKLDRILVSHNFFEAWPVPCLEILPRRFSDHCPLLLRSVVLDCGPPPFRFFNSWLSDSSLESAVKLCWASRLAPSPTLTPISHLSVGLKHLKNCIKSWREKSLAVKNATLKSHKLKVNSLDLKAESDGLSISERLIGSIWNRKFLRWKRRIYRT